MDTSTTSTPSGAAPSGEVARDAAGPGIAPEQATAPTIADEAGYHAAVSTLSRRARPPWLLRALMGALESYRQSRKMGWSRPQNKYGVMTFHAFKLSVGADRALVELGAAVLAAELPELGEAERAFVAELLADPKLMGFLFVSDVVDGEQRFETATLSLGRIAAGQPRHRDRIDIIVESAIVDGKSQGLSRLRVYVDPFRQPIKEHPATSYVRQVPASSEARALLTALSEYYRHWAPLGGRDFSHWTQAYIDYFGPRTEPVRGSFFPDFEALAAEAQRRTRRSASAVASLG